MTPAILNYESSCSDVVHEFLTCYFVNVEEGYTLEEIEWYWVADEVGGIIFVDDYFCDMYTILTALRLEVPREIFFAWYDETVEKEKNINLSSYYRMCRTCTHPTKSPAKKDAGEGETNYFICDDCKKPC